MQRRRLAPTCHSSPAFPASGHPQGHCGAVSGPRAERRIPGRPPMSSSRAFAIPVPRLPPRATVANPARSWPPAGARATASTTARSWRRPVEGGREPTAEEGARHRRSRRLWRTDSARSTRVQSGPQRVHCPPLPSSPPLENRGAWPGSTRPGGGSEFGRPALASSLGSPSNSRPSPSTWPSPAPRSTPRTLGRMVLAVESIHRLVERRDA